MTGINKIKDQRKISTNKMNRDNKKALKIIGVVYPDIVQVQVRDYCPRNYAIIIKNKVQMTQNKQKW